MKFRQGELKQLRGGAIICKNMSHLSFTVDLVNICRRPREMSCTATSCMYSDETRIGKLKQRLAGDEANLIWKVIIRNDIADDVVVRVLCGAKT